MFKWWIKTAYFRHDIYLLDPSWTQVSWDVINVLLIFHHEHIASEHCAGGNRTVLWAVQGQIESICIYLTHNSMQVFENKYVMQCNLWLEAASVPLYDFPWCFSQTLWYKVSLPYHLFCSLESESWLVKWKVYIRVKFNRTITLTNLTESDVSNSSKDGVLELHPCELPSYYQDSPRCLYHRASPAPWWPL